MTWLSGLRRPGPETGPAVRELSAEEQRRLIQSLPDLRLAEEAPAGAGWLAVIEIAQPRNRARLADHQLVGAVTSRLHGRAPFFFVEDDSLRGWFSVAGVGDSDFELVRNFAEAVATAMEAGPTEIQVATIDWFDPGQAVANAVEADPEPL